jgi:hypothetical protein
MARHTAVQTKIVIKNIMSQIQLNEISFSGTAYLGMPFNESFRNGD